MGRPVNDADILLDIDNGKVLPPEYLNYHNIFCAIYSQPWDISETSRDNLGTLLADALNLIELAEYLGCVEAIAKRVDATIIGHDQVLYQ